MATWTCRETTFVRAPIHVSSSRAPVGIGVPAVVIVITPAGIIARTAPIVFQVTSIAVVSSVAATVSDSLGLHSVYSNGWVGSYTGVITTIAGGKQYSISAPVTGGGWPIGTISLSVLVS